MASVESSLSQDLEFTPHHENLVGEEYRAGTHRNRCAARAFTSTGWTGLTEGGDSVARGLYSHHPQATVDVVEDSGLIRRLSAGDEEALGTIMDRYGGALLHFAHRMVGDLQLAEEIYQDTLMKAWQQAGTFRVDGHLKAWLFRVARNHAIDYMRKKRVLVDEYTTCAETVATTFRPEREAERSWLCAEIFDVIDSLPPAYREVIDLRFFHHLCYQEISAALRIPLGTVKSRINYALTRLSKLLRERGIDRNLVADN